MKTCPVCNSPMLDSAQSCSSCGYHLQGSTQKFEAVSLETSEPETIQVTSTIPTLTVLQGKQKGIVYSLDGDKAVIGRSPKCEIFLNDMTVSRKHAVLERVAGQKIHYYTSYLISLFCVAQHKTTNLDDVSIR